LEDEFKDLSINVKALEVVLRIILKTRDYSSSLGLIFNRCQQINFILEDSDYEVKAQIKEISRIGEVMILFDNSLILR